MCAPTLSWLRRCVYTLAEGRYVPLSSPYIIFQCTTSLMVIKPKADRSNSLKFPLATKKFKYEHAQAFLVDFRYYRKDFDNYVVEVYLRNVYIDMSSLKFKITLIPLLLLVEIDKINDRKLRNVEREELFRKVVQFYSFTYH
jgi:hypothetical protein